ncbi:MULTISPECIES: DUF5723 family protein [unclassified Flavobacterium]|uniref:DUF5723 family protein n=1 Tax=unclassified Flavobacterium TaxID=196869 RepID=UPI003F90376D
MRIKYLLLLLIVSFSSLSQNKQILYNFTSIPQSMMSNPGADVKYKYYFGVPLLSGISANVGSTGFSTYDLYAKNDVNFNTKLRQVVNSVSRNDKLLVNEQVELFTGGFQLGNWEKKGYVSFGMYQEFDFVSYMPKDLAIIALDGNRDHLGKVFNLGDLNMKTEMLSVLHIGYHKNLNENFIVGGRAKLYSSAFNAQTTNNSGYIYTIPGENTIYEQVIYSDSELNTSGVAKYFEDDYEGDAASDIIKKTLFGGNLGLGFDAGFTYYPKKNTQITASITDVGFIKHSKEVKTFTYKGYYKYEGVNPNFDTANNSGSTYEEFQNAIPYDSVYTKYTTWRPAKLNASYQYSFDESRTADCNCSGEENEFKSAVGGQLFVMTLPRKPIMALTAYYQRQLVKNLNVKATYTLDSFSYTNIGLGLSAQIGKLNMYLLADNLLEYRDVSKANSLSFQFGFNFIFKEVND